MGLSSSGRAALPFPRPLHTYSMLRRRVSRIDTLLFAGTALLVAGAATDSLAHSAAAPIPAG